MTIYKCPDCGQMCHQLNDSEIYYCDCGMTFRTISSDIHYTVDDTKKERIREVMDAALEYYHRKDEEMNKLRESRKQRTLDYLVSELLKGPIVGGTMAEPSILCREWGTMNWSALQRAVLIRDEKCMICGQKPSVEVHHIRPRHLKGHDHPRNLIELCLECHDEVHRRIDSGIQKTLETSLTIPLNRTCTLEAFYKEGKE